MRMTETKLKGSYIIEPEIKRDDRGFFARTFDKKKFDESGLNSQLLQCNISFNEIKGTIRGIHYQESPHQEIKLVRCTKGKIFDVIVDLRLDSKTYWDWFGIELSAENYKMLYVPKGFAHGFQTLENNSEVFYQMTDCYMPKFARGIRWDDKKIGIKWPLPLTRISEKDLSFKILE